LAASRSALKNTNVVLPSGRISFAKIHEPLEVPNLLDLQINSYNWLIGNEAWQADVEELHKRLTDLTFPPEKVVGGAAVLMEEVAATKISGEEDRYSHTDLWDFQANFEGAYKIVELFKPLIAREDKAFLDKTEKNFETVFNTLKKYRTKDGGFVTYDKLTEGDRKILSARVNTLAEDLSKLRGMFGLN